MNTTRTSTAVGAAALVALNIHATAQVEIDQRLPEGKNRELAARMCTSCHNASYFTSTVGRTRAGWDAKIEDMVAYGMKITSGQRALVLDYLTTYLPP
jgi:formate-dependent nitrite reductase cytochrome c552 subunit